MNHTLLSKKEQARIRYGKQQARVRAEKANKTRPSDTRVRTASGISGKSKPQSEFVSRFPPPRSRDPRAGLLAQLDQLLGPRVK